MTDSFRGKAQFRAMRERVGLSRLAVAELLHNRVDTVKGWENPSYRWDPPEDAWRLLDDMMARHMRVVGEAVKRVEDAVAAEGGKPSCVMLPYFRSQAQYDEFGRDPGRFEVANANAMEIGVVLEHDGYEVVYLYPEERDLGAADRLAGARS
ncbi:MAG: hypothetical protein SOI13_01500 [Bifidobacterium mongoliense]|uniref:helix-turn-helix domain-containing protein n=1 Tax=Bifidobacterium mongoliense TaxID=518643 RepID=UPI002F350E2A